MVSVDVFWSQSTLRIPYMQVVAPSSVRFFRKTCTEIATWNLPKEEAWTGPMKTLHRSSFRSCFLWWDTLGVGEYLEQAYKRLTFLLPFSHKFSQKSFYRRNYSRLSRDYIAWVKLPSQLSSANPPKYRFSHWNKPYRSRLSRLFPISSLDTSYFWVGNRSTFETWSLCTSIIKKKKANPWQWKCEIEKQLNELSDMVITRREMKLFHKFGNK